MELLLTPSNFAVNIEGLLFFEFSKKSETANGGFDSLTICINDRFFTIATLPVFFKATKIGREIKSGVWGAQSTSYMH